MLQSSNNKNLFYKAYKYCLENDFKIIHFHEVMFIPYAILLSLKKDVNVIYDVHEVVFQQYWNSGRKNKLWTKTQAVIYNILESAFARMNNSIITVVPHQTKRFKRLSNKVLELPNFPPLSFIPSDSAIQNKEYDLVYTGSITEDRGIRTLVHLASLGYKIVLCGRFSPNHLKDEILSLPGSENIQYLGEISKEEVVKTLFKSKVGLALLDNKPNYQIAYPVKLFEYMAAGIAVIASDFPLWKEIITKTKSGITVSPENIQNIESSIVQLLQNNELLHKLGQNGNEAFRSRYNWESNESLLLNFYDRMCTN